MGLALFYRGHGGEALRHLEASIASYRDGDFQLVTFGLGHDQGIFARAMSAWVLWWLGRPDEALAEAQAGVTRAQELGSFLSLAMARHFLAMVHQLRRESEDALREAEVNATLAHELGFPFWEGAALVTAGAERAKTGEKRGLVDVQRGLELLSDAGSRSVTSSGLATLAEAHHATGDTRAAHGTVEAALGLSRERGEPYWDPELMRPARNTSPRWIPTPARAPTRSCARRSQRRTSLEPWTRPSRSDSCSAGGLRLKEGPPRRRRWRLPRLLPSRVGTKPPTCTTLVPS